MVVLTYGLYMLQYNTEHKVTLGTSQACVHHNTMPIWQGVSMKWSKLKKLVATYPWIWKAINMSMDTWWSDENDCPQDILRHHATMKVDYVAFRPFEKLPLERWGSFESKEAGMWYLITRLGVSNYYNGHSNDNCLTLDQWIKSENESHEFYKKQEVLFFVAFVRINTGMTLGSRRIEIYPFPNGYCHINKFPEVPMTDGDQRAHLAYMRHEPLSPLLPGTTSFA